MTLIETYFAELYRGYLGQDYSASLRHPDAVWPAPAEVPRKCPHDDAAATLPVLGITGVEEKTRHPYIMQVTVFVRLQVQAQIGSPDAEEEKAGTPTQTALAWFQAVEEALRDTECFRTYLMSLSDAERTGGQIMLRLPDHGIAHVYDDKDRVHQWEIRIEHKVDVSPGP